MANFLSRMFGGGGAKSHCPICGGTSFYHAPVGRADTWHRQVDNVPQWKRARGLAEKAGVAFSEPRLEWDQPTFERSDTPTPHVRCTTCASLIPPQFHADPGSRVLLITTGMPQAGKTTWLKCLFKPERQRYLIAQPTQQIAREPYEFIEPYTIGNPDPRTAVPILLHGMDLTFQRSEIAIAGVDVKGEVFDQRGSNDKYMRVRQVLKNLRSMEFAELFLMFVVPFDPTGTRANIGQLTTHLINEPGARGVWQGVIWTHLDRAVLRDQNRLLEFLAPSRAASDLARRVVGGTGEVFDSQFANAFSEIARLVQKTRDWKSRRDVLESLTWLLYQCMLAYAELPARFNSGKLEFYYSFMDGLGSLLVRQCMQLASALFIAWDSSSYGDFAGMIAESMTPGAELSFPVLPCGMEFLQGSGQDVSTADRDDGLPVWGDLLLLEILRRHV